MTIEKITIRENTQEKRIEKLEVDLANLTETLKSLAEATGCETMYSSSGRILIFGPVTPPRHWLEFWK